VCGCIASLRGRLLAGSRVGRGKTFTRFTMPGH
jgi:hypothetical protein